MPTYVVTGGAGFIGSNIVAALDDRGDDVIVVDTLGIDEKWRNLSKRRLRDILRPEQALSALDNLENKVAAVLHMGAISSTTEANVDLIIENNFRFSCQLWNWCARNGVPFVYASSAATYGDGTKGFEDRDGEEYLAQLQPLNAYGWSKHLFDRWVANTCRLGRPKPPSWAGLKFFNVYGPNEMHKGPQRSVALQIFQQISAGEPVRLFKSHHPNYPDGGQLRDFVWVGDCVDVVLWHSGNSPHCGLYNVGTGRARSFAELAAAVYDVMGREPAIEYVAMPETLRHKYQYRTEAVTGKLAAAGYPFSPLPMEEGVRRYVRDYLMTEHPFR